MNLTKLVWAETVMMVVVFLSLCACAGSKRRHRNRNKSTSVPLTADSDTASNGTLTPRKASMVDSTGRQNGYKMWTIDKYPNPQKQPRTCGRSRQPSFLCDPDKILSPTEGNNILASD
jgi:hypothetical protein